MKVTTLLVAAMLATTLSVSAKGKDSCVFEMRTYYAAPGKLETLNERFRNHTMSLFAKHGMTNLFYWQPSAGQPTRDNTLIYFLAHESEEAAKTSFTAFRANPEWITIKKASEDKAGGSLTVPDGGHSLRLITAPRSSRYS